MGGSQSSNKCGECSGKDGDSLNKQAFPALMCRNRDSNGLNAAAVSVTAHCRRKLRCVTPLSLPAVVPLGQAGYEVCQGQDVLGYAHVGQSTSMSVLQHP
jgi:hypothetical protein